MDHALDQPRFAVQLALFDYDGLVTLVCDVCHGHTLMPQDSLYLLAPDRVGCAQCGAVNDLPNAEAP